MPRDPQTAKRYALFKDGVRVSKAHSTRYAVEVEAFEAGLMIKSTTFIAAVPGVEIKEAT